MLRQQSTPTFEDQIAADKTRLEAQVARLPDGRKKDELVKKIRQLETTSHISDWLPRRGFDLQRIEKLRPLQTTSTSLAVPTAISFASFAQLVLVEASLSQFAAHVPANWSLAGLPVSAAISFAPLP